jgi:polar amino acid transport system ATP-binding protein
MTSVPMVKAERVEKRFGRLEVLKDVSLEVARSEVVCMLGPSGSGKSTFLRCINHLEKIDGGQIEVNDHFIGYRRRNGELVEDSERNIARQRTEIGMVFQRFNLFPHKTALENVTEAPIHVLGIRKEDAIDKATVLLGRVGLADKIDTYPGKLSGGQQQRVAIARALVTQPSLFLADEPTGNLDSQTSIEILAILQELNERGITIMLVTHEQDIANYSRRQVRFRDGRIIGDTANLTPSVAQEFLPQAAAAHQETEEKEVSS